MIATPPRPLGSMIVGVTGHNDPTDEHLPGLEKAVEDFLRGTANNAAGG